MGQFKKEDEWYAFEGIVEAETPKAFLFKGHYWDKAEWIPRSQSRVVERNKEAVPETMTIEIKAWLCEKNGFNVE